MLNNRRIKLISTHLLQDFCVYIITNYIEDFIVELKEDNKCTEKNNWRPTVAEKVSKNVLSCRSLCMHVCQRGLE